ncbi:response regulator transcription factor [Aliishimia ponticola]|uniref:Response regulator transcription factor n=1 Tax=Aliishimia ponticola TaxID=2499833 RepID=A0A4S4NDY9_9RHOB|nr:response regulator transcription factor [Aliishimia ponticola]THH36757.1 response regulator transcription factor [Aliishimia ponticola]
MSDPQILIIDDDAQIREVLRIAVRQAGMVCDEAGDGAEGLAKARSGRFDLLVLDIGLPRMDGLAVCRELRTTSDVPVLFLTARDDEIDRVLGFELGGDDYVSKPFSPRELVGRIKAILKRTRDAAPVVGTDGYARGRLRLHPERHHCDVGGVPIGLTGREMDILALLMAQPERVFARPALVDRVWGAGMVVSDRTLDSHLRNLRFKLTEAGCPDAIETLHGVGIRMGACRGG